MDAALILLKQLISMFIFMGIGFVLFRKKLITEGGSKELSNLLLYIVLPAVIIRSYYVERTPSYLKGLGLSFGLSALLLLLAMVVSGLLFGRRKRIENIGVAFSNCGFMGIPLVRAVMGEEAVFFCSAFVAILLLLQWTYGVYIMTDDKEAISVSKIFTNPVLIATVIGVAIFLIQIPLPTVAVTALDSLGALNAPVAMIILGVYLAQANIRSIFTDKKIYWASLIRLAVIPLASIAVLCLLPDTVNPMKLTLLISASAPIGANVAIFSQKVGLDYTHAVKLVCLSTILSIISMPLLILVASHLWLV